jgi:hypothetical protein
MDKFFRIREELSILLRRLALETIRSKKKGTGTGSFFFIFRPSFHVRSGIRSGMKNCSDPGTGIEHPDQHHCKKVRMRDREYDIGIRNTGSLCY